MSFFNLLGNLIIHLHLNFLPKLRKNDKNVVFGGRPTGTAANRVQWLLVVHEMQRFYSFSEVLEEKF